MIWSPATHFAHVKSGVVLGSPERFVAACGAIVMVTPQKGELPRCESCARVAKGGE